MARRWAAATRCRSSRTESEAIHSRRAERRGCVRPLRSDGSGPRLRSPANRLTPADQRVGASASGGYRQYPDAGDGTSGQGEQGPPSAAVGASARGTALAVVELTFAAVAVSEPIGGSLVASVERAADVSGGARAGGDRDAGNAAHAATLVRHAPTDCRCGDRSGAGGQGLRFGIEPGGDPRAGSTAVHPSEEEPTGEDRVRPAPVQGTQRGGEVLRPGQAVPTCGDTLRQVGEELLGIRLGRFAQDFTSLSCLGSFLRHT